MAGIMIDAKVDRIQVPENLRYFRLIEEQKERCAEVGCQAEFYKFGLGQSPFPVPSPLQKALSLHSGMGTYADPIGNDEVRKAVASFFKARFDLDVVPGRVITGHGAKGLIFSVFTLLTGSVIIPSPGWLGYLPQLRILNVPYYRLYTYGAGNFKIRPQALEAMLKGLVKTQHLLILNNPGNPTGGLYTKEELTVIADICRKYYTFVLSDEVYSLLTYDPSSFVSMGKSTRKALCNSQPFCRNGCRRVQAWKLYHARRNKPGNYPRYCKNCSNNIYQLRRTTSGSWNRSIYIRQRDGPVLRGGQKHSQNYYLKTYRDVQNNQGDKSDDSEGRFLLHGRLKPANE